MGNWCMCCTSHLDLTVFKHKFGVCPFFSQTSGLRKLSSQTHHMSSSPRLLICPIEWVPPWVPSPWDSGLRERHSVAWPHGQESGAPELLAWEAAGHRSGRGSRGVGQPSQEAAGPDGVLPCWSCALPVWESASPARPL